MKKVTCEFWISFEKPWGAYTLYDGELWKIDTDKDENYISEPYKIEDVRGYEHIIKEIEWFCRDE